MAIARVRGGGGVLGNFHTYVGSDHFLGFKILNFNIFGGFQKNKYFSGYEDFVDIFLGSSQNWIIFRVISMQFWVQNFEFQYFWGFSKK